MLVSATRLRVRSAVLLPRLMWHSIKSMRQAPRAPGFVGGRTLISPWNVFWTITAWENEDAMQAFRTTAAHRAAMPKLLILCDEASVVHWSQDTPELPSWQESHRRLMAEGRPSKVNHPSPDHLKNKYPPPHPGRLEVVLKPRNSKAN